MPSGLPRQLTTIESELELDPQLESDALDHEGRYVLASELRACECGSRDGYTLPDGSVTCADCIGYERLRISVLAVRRWERRSRSSRDRRARAA